MQRPVPFFATRADILSILQIVESERPLQYVLCGLFDYPTRRRWDSASQIEELGFAPSGNPVVEPRYLVAATHAEVTLREVPQRRGGVKYSIDLKENQHAIGFSAGGEFSPEIVIAGQLGRGTEHPTSRLISDGLFDQLRTQFRRVRSYYVGPEALEKLKGGARLTANATASTVYDLRL